MALIACPDCGQAVSDLAPACPSCGYPIAASNPLAQLATASRQPTRSRARQPKRPPLMRALAILFFGVSLVLALGSMLYMTPYGQITLGAPDAWNLIFAAMLAGIGAVFAYLAQPR